MQKNDGRPDPRLVVDLRPRHPGSHSPAYLCERSPPPSRRCALQHKRPRAQTRDKHATSGFDLLSSTLGVRRWTLGVSQVSPSVIIFRRSPPSGFTKIVRFAPPFLRLRIAVCGITRSERYLIQPCALKFAGSSAQAFFTSNLLLKTTCSTAELVFDVRRVLRQCEIPSP